MRMRGPRPGAPAWNSRPRRILARLPDRLAQPPGQPARPRARCSPARPSSASSATARRSRSSPWRAPSGRATSAPATTATRPSCWPSALLTVEQFFAQLYADADVEHEPCSAGRSMTAHFATCLLEARRPLQGPASSCTTPRPTSRPPARRCRAWSASPTPRASTASCPSWPAAIRALLPPRRRGRLRHDRQRQLRRGHVLGGGQRRAGVLGRPMLLSIWDDGYGISVPNEHQITKGDLSAVLAGFRREPGIAAGLRPLRRQGLGLPGALRDLPARRREIVRREHVPAHPPRHRDHPAAGALDLGQPRALQVEASGWTGRRSTTACARCGDWMMEQGIATAAELDRLEEEDRTGVREAQQPRLGRLPRRRSRPSARELLGLLERRSARRPSRARTAEVARADPGARAPEPARSAATCWRADRGAHRDRAAGDAGPARQQPRRPGGAEQEEVNRERYSSHLYCEASSALAVSPSARRLRATTRRCSTASRC